MWKMRELTDWERQLKLESKMKIAAVAMGDVIECIKSNEIEEAKESLTNIKMFLESK
jgi:hypothetical protein